MGYATFTDALTQAKRNAQLRGMPFSTRDMQNLHSGYMSSAGQRNITNRQLALQGDSLSAQQNYWANQLANEREATGLTLAQQLAIAKQGWANDYEIAAAANATNLGIAGDANTTNTNIANNTNTTNTNISNNTIAANKDNADKQADAANKASQNQLYGNVALGAAGLGGAYLLSGPDTVGKSLSGIKGLFGGEPAPTTTPGDSLLTQQGPMLQPDPSLTPSGTQPLQASQTVNAPPTTGLDAGGARLEIPSTSTPGDIAGAGAKTGDAAGLIGDAGDLTNVTADSLSGVSASGLSDGTTALSGAGQTVGQVAGGLAAAQGLYEGSKNPAGRGYFNAATGLASIFAPQVGLMFAAGQIPAWLAGSERGPSGEESMFFNDSYQRLVDNYKAAGKQAPTPEEYVSIMGRPQTFNQGIIEGYNDKNGGPGEWFRNLKDDLGNAQVGLVDPDYYINEFTKRTGGTPNAGGTYDAAARHRQILESIGFTGF